MRFERMASFLIRRGASAGVPGASFSHRDQPFRPLDVGGLEQQLVLLDGQSSYGALGLSTVPDSGPAISCICAE